jgi:hypothetical protein
MSPGPSTQHRQCIQPAADDDDYDFGPCPSAANLTANCCGGITSVCKEILLVCISFPRCGSIYVLLLFLCAVLLPLPTG